MPLFNPPVGAAAGLFDGTKYFTPSSSPAGSGDQTTAVQDAVNAALDQEYRGLWLGNGTIILSDQILVRNPSGFAISGAGAQITGMGNSGSSPPVRSAGTRIIWKGAADRAAFLFSDARASGMQDVGFHCDPTSFELLSCIDCISNSADSVNTPTGAFFRRLSMNGVNVVSGHAGIHFGIRFPTSASYSPPANAQDANNDYATIEDIEASTIQILLEFAGSQQKNMHVNRVRVYGIAWDQLNDTNLAAKTKCIIAAGALYNPAADTWTSSVGGNFHAREMSGSRSVVGDVVIGTPNNDGSSWVGGNVEGSARMVARMPGITAVNVASPFKVRGVRWAHLGRIPTDMAYADLHWPGPHVFEGNIIEDSNQVPTSPGSGVATGTYNPLHLAIEPPSTIPAAIRVEHNHIQSTTYDLVRPKGSNPKRVEIVTRGNIRRNDTDDSYAVHPSHPFDFLFNAYEYDDFILLPNTGGIVGKGWLPSNAANISQVTTEASHEGITRLTTTATSGTFTFIRNCTNSGGGAHLPASSFVARFVFRLNNNDANTTMRVGLFGSAGSAAPTAGAYLEKADGDTNWFFVCGQGSVYTRTDTGVAVDTGWHRLRIRRVSATEMGFTLDTGTEVLITTNLPTTGQMAVWQITNSAAAAKTVDADYWDHRVTGMIR